MSVSPAKPMSPGVVVLRLALLLGIQPITTDLYLPALPALTTELGARISQGQLTLTALLLCFGVSQLFFGPLSVRFGRRPVPLGDSEPQRAQIVIRKRLPGRRIDKYQHGRFRKFSRTTIQRLIKQGDITVNANAATDD